MAEPSFRPAHPDEADALGEMVIAGVSHWGHHLNFPEAVEGVRQHGLPTVDYVASAPVHVLEDAAGTIGFYGLVVEDDFVDLRPPLRGVGPAGRDLLPVPVEGPAGRRRRAAAYAPVGRRCRQPSVVSPRSHPVPADHR